MSNSIPVGYVTDVSPVFKNKEDEEGAPEKHLRFRIAISGRPIIRGYWALSPHSTCGILCALSTQVGFWSEIPNQEISAY